MVLSNANPLGCIRWFTKEHSYVPLWPVVFRMGNNLKIREVLKIDVVYGFVIPVKTVNKSELGELHNPIKCCWELTWTGSAQSVVEPGKQSSSLLRSYSPTRTTELHVFNISNKSMFSNQEISECESSLPLCSSCIRKQSHKIVSLNHYMRSALTTGRC